MSETSAKYWKLSVPIDIVALRENDQFRSGADDSEIFAAFKTLLKDSSRTASDALASQGETINDPDALIASWGGVSSNGNEMRWSPPDSLPTPIVEYLQSSIRRLNALLRRGELVIDVNGNIRPRREA